MKKVAPTASVKINAEVLELLKYRRKQTGVSITWMLSKAVSEWLIKDEDAPKAKRIVRGDS